MRLNKFFKTMGPIAAIAAAAALGGCNNVDLGVNGMKGVPLDELDLSGGAPEEVALMGPDHVSIVNGESFNVTVEGDSEVASHLRFALKDGTLGIMRDELNFGSDSIATVKVTMPAPRSLTVAGSGRMTSERLSGDAEVTIAGSGWLETPNVSAESLEVTIAGSGNYKAAGTVKSLELSVAGSGTADMAGLKVDNAELNIAGSGDAIFASDGNVEASIMGSGDVTVRGSARCEVNAVGSGRLTCEPAANPAE
ncbi:hypothetical protein FHS61_000950 [Altererythrobacter atlanticus]|uniref:Putative auto-transporter adhesin head GIN domain-containing protein n=1 Tax=Croceibacterium atlanticum TaxID=1267766 RepID=A0A0F7KSC0_9SPHN|nr:head GIN domain-containing protein [Croceibacterium atlanticum]AKH43348.1 hypothetical protein WYH_02316 [Croceibacterium atlanticum]MBB5731946.1 hypothetical protein [Croceibacterium atlanticum]